MCYKSPEIKRKVEVDMNRSERDKIMSEFHDLHKSIMSTLDSFSSDIGSSMISYSQLSLMSFDEWFDLGQGVRFMRVNHPEKELFFITEMNPKAEFNLKAVFGIQKHDCKEVVCILEGELIETMENGKRYTKGDTVIYPPNFLHKPFATVFSRYSVEFIK